MVHEQHEDPGVAHLVFFGLVLILGQGHMRDFFVVGQIALWVATITALVSAVDYYRRFPPAPAP